MGATLQVIVLVAAGALLFWALRKGHLLRVTRYVQETREELLKCTWPSADELKGSTVVVLISSLLLGLYIVGVDAVVLLFVKLITSV
jgi:preprotein translocase subunit SecE